jgi:hypothetical protein
MQRKSHRPASPLSLRVALAYVGLGGPGGHFYEILSVIVISAGVNLLTSTTNWFSEGSTTLEGLMLMASGGLVYFLAQKVKDYHARARDQQILEKRGLKREHLKRILRFELETRPLILWLETLSLIAALSIASAGVFRIVNRKPASAVTTEERASRENPPPSGASEKVPPKKRGLHQAKPGEGGRMK